METSDHAGSGHAKPLVENLREDPRRHIVQFYRDDTQLLETVTRSIGGTLTAGGAAIVLATPARREMLAERLTGQGLDVAGAAQEGRYVAKDAAETLATFMVDGWPDRARFQKVIGTTVMRTAMTARREHPRLVAFGEMVAVLWERGQASAALQLEHLWNELLEKHSFTLYCGYPMSAFSETSDTEPFHAVCAAHSSVIPATDENGDVFSEDGAGGKLKLSSAGSGTTVRVSVPWSRAQVEDAWAIH